MSQPVSDSVLCLVAPGLRTPLAVPCSYPSPFGMVAHPGLNGELSGAGAAYTGLHNISPQMSAVAAAAVAAYGRTQVVLEHTRTHTLFIPARIIPNVMFMPGFTAVYTTRVMEDMANVEECAAIETVLFLLGSQLGWILSDCSFGDLQVKNIKKWVEKFIF